MRSLSRCLRKAVALASLILLLSGGAVYSSPSGQGALTIIEPGGKEGQGCPLEHTSVSSEISGFVARVSVTQTFHNPRKEKIEAVYTFPLSEQGAVDEMVMQVGDRVVRGEIKRREEARQIYERARDRGHVASLLDQERPNIFTQSVANIMPGERVRITIKYVEILPYEDGAFSFVFPMVVGPRFIPGRSAGREGTGWAEDTAQVPDASRITPPVTAEGTRAGHDIDLTVSIDAGVPISAVESKLHEVTVERQGATRARVSLKNQKEVPNKDFVLKYLVAGNEVRSAVLTHKDGKEGYVTLIVIPPKRVKPDQIAPREMIFVIDCSGSQRGKPLEKAKDAMRYFIDQMNPDDTFNIIDFNVGARMLFPAPRKNTTETRDKALRYLNSLEANGGTWMGPAVETVAKTQPDANRLRIVTFMTDGYVGNDFEIISLVKKLRGKSRWFPFGAGNSVNRFLLDTMARVGGGEVEYILLNSPGEEVARRFYERIAAPVLTDISLTFEGVSVEERYPAEVSDLWSRKPLVFRARYAAAGKGMVTVQGFSGGKPYEQKVPITLPDKNPANRSLGVLWARAKVDDLMDQDLMGIQRGAPKNEIKEKIVRVALAHRILTQFTSFVAVEETTITVDGKPTKVTVPVEMPDGVSREGVFGDRKAEIAMPAATRGYMARPGKISSAGEGGLRLPKEAVGVGFTQARMTEKEKRRPLSQVADALVATKDSEVQVQDNNGLGKLAPELRALLSQGRPEGTSAEGRVRIKDGKVIVQVWISGGTDDLFKLLEEKGLRITFKASTGKTVIGEVSTDNLKNLASVPQVVFIEPAPVE